MFLDPSRNLPFPTHRSIYWRDKDFENWLKFVVESLLRIFFPNIFKKNIRNIPGMLAFDDNWGLEPSGKDESRSQADFTTNIEISFQNLYHIYCSIGTLEIENFKSLCWQIEKENHSPQSPQGYCKRSVILTKTYQSFVNYSDQTNNAITILKTNLNYLSWSTWDRSVHVSQFNFPTIIHLILKFPIVDFTDFNKKS